jgi:hypothetical protein
LSSSQVFLFRDLLADRGVLELAVLEVEVERDHAKVSAKVGDCLLAGGGDWGSPTSPLFLPPLLFTLVDPLIRSLPPLLLRLLIGMSSADFARARCCC